MGAASSLIATAGLCCLLPYAVSVFKAPVKDRNRISVFWGALIFTFYAVAGILEGWIPYALFNTTVASFLWWLWNKLGGGKGLKRRLKALRKRFSGVRRTAPQLT